MPPKLNLNIPLSVVENKPFGPYSFPGSATDNYAEYPQIPMQKCHASVNDTGVYSWTRPVECYVAVPGTKFGANWTTDKAIATNIMKVDPVLCSGFNTANMGTLGLNTFPAYRQDTGAQYMYTDYDAASKAAGKAAFPVGSYSYNSNSIDSCMGAYNVNSWSARGNITG